MSVCKSVVCLQEAVEGDRFTEENEDDFLLSFLFDYYVHRCVNTCVRGRFHSFGSCSICLLEDPVLPACCLNHGVRHDGSPALADHQSQVRELILYFTAWEANASHELAWDVYNGSDFYRHRLSFLMVLKLRHSELVLISSNKEGRYVIAVWILPRVAGLLALDHLLEFSNELLWLTCLLEHVGEQSL